MKLFKITCIIFLTTFMFSCNKKTNEVAATKDTTSMGESRESAKMEDGEKPSMRGEGRRRGGDPEQRKKRLEVMYAELNLSEAQITKANEINDKYSARMKVLRENRTGDREAMRASMMEMRKLQNEEYKNIMTEEQYTKYQKMLQEQRKKRGERRGGRG